MRMASQIRSCTVSAMLAAEGRTDLGQRHGKRIARARCLRAVQRPPYVDSAGMMCPSSTQPLSRTCYAPARTLPAHTHRPHNARTVSAKSSAPCVTCVPRPMHLCAHCTTRSGRLCGHGTRPRTPRPRYAQTLSAKPSTPRSLL